jgi:hypothetical protein
MVAGHKEADRLNSVPVTATVSMNRPDEEMSLVIFNEGEILPSDHEVEILLTSYQPQKLCQFLLLSLMIMNIGTMWLRNVLLVQCRWPLDIRSYVYLSRTKLTTRPLRQTVGHSLTQQWPQSSSKHSLPY